MDIAILVGHFICMRMKAAVCSDYSVAAERIVRRVDIIELTSEDEYMVRTCLLRVCRPTLSLIHEVPNESTLISRIFTDHVPIFLQASHRITHRMGIFTLDQRLRRIVPEIFTARIVCVIHRAEDIRIILKLCSFILDRT